MRLWKWVLFSVGFVPVCILCLLALSAMSVFGGYMVQYVGPVPYDSFEWRFTFGKVTIGDRHLLFWVIVASLLVGIGWFWYKICAVLSGLRASHNEQKIPNHTSEGIRRPADGSPKPSM